MAERKDAAAIQSLTASVPNASAWTQAVTERAVESSGHIVLIAEDAGAGQALLGFIAAHDLSGGEYEIENLAVGLPWQRQGLAAKLLHELMTRARSRRAAKIFLEVRESNAAARALYAAAGFHESGRRSGYYSKPDEDAILLTLQV